MAEGGGGETSTEIPKIWEYIKCNGHFMTGVQIKIYAISA